MATAWMANDDLAINKINPYTWSGTFGVPSDGSKWKSDGTYSVEIDERPTVYTDPNPALKDFNPVHLMRSGPMYLKEMPGHAAAPFNGFPARKYEYDEEEDEEEGADEGDEEEGADEAASTAHWRVVERD